VRAFINQGHAARIAVAVAIVWLACQSPALAFEMGLPIACSLGVDCAVQHYVDRDPGPGVEDYRCGSETYDGHDGIDLRIPNLKAMARGVDVLAAAPGTVLRTRDGVADQFYSEEQPAAVADRECGNGLIIDHGGGWSTQYCHLRNGSVRVKPGDAVAEGAILGEVGLSGMTQFPHLHVTVRKDAQVVDPFDTTPLGEKPTCNAASPIMPQSLWTASLRDALAYRPVFILNVGFAAGPLSMSDVESGSYEGVQIALDSPALVFFGRSIGIRKGDRQRVELFLPDGSTLTTDETDPADRAKAQLFAYAGKKRPPAGWPSGTFRGRYSVVRDDAVIASKEATITVPPAQ
jgi:hypothetical protein